MDIRFIKLISFATCHCDLLKWVIRHIVSLVDTSSANFDVTLIVCLLRNIPLPGIYPPVTGWDNLPNPNDKSPGAYLARIKYFRNEIAHSIENNLNNIDFQDKWKALNEVCTLYRQLCDYKWVWNQSIAYLYRYFKFKKFIGYNKFDVFKDLFVNISNSFHPLILDNCRQ